MGLFDSDKEWDNATTEEKLDDLRDFVLRLDQSLQISVQHITNRANLALSEVRGAVEKLERRLTVLESPRSKD